MMNKLKKNNQLNLDLFEKAAVHSKTEFVEVL